MFREVDPAEIIYGKNICDNLKTISTCWKQYVTGLHSDTDIIKPQWIGWTPRTVSDEKIEYVSRLLKTIGNIPHLAHPKINNFILQFSEQQLGHFLKQFDELSENDKKNHMLQIYLCTFILYPEIGAYMSLDDQHYVMTYNTYFINRMFLKNDYLLTKEQVIEYISIGKIVSHDSEFAKYYLDAPLEEKTKINAFSEALSKFRPLCRESCCNRYPSNMESYYHILMAVPDEKRDKIMEYILKSNYKSLFIIDQMANYFSTLTFEEMETHFARAKAAWPDIHIDYTHRFENLFIDLLKLDYIPPEEEIIKMAQNDSTSRPDIDLCYWNYSSEEEINKETCERIGIPYVHIDD